MNTKLTPEFFLDQYGHVYAWRETETGKVSEVILDNRHSKATFDEKCLIAAATDLLAAAKRGVMALEANGAPNCEAAKELRAAIAKAEGKA
jgi:hypothetical protein